MGHPGMEIRSLLVLIALLLLVYFFYCVKFFPSDGASSDWFVPSFSDSWEFMEESAVVSYRGGLTFIGPLFLRGEVLVFIPDMLEARFLTLTQGETPEWLCSAKDPFYFYFFEDTSSPMMPLNSCWLVISPLSEDCWAIINCDTPIFSSFYYIDWIYSSICARYSVPKRVPPWVTPAVPGNGIRLLA